MGLLLLAINTSALAQASPQPGVTVGVRFSAQRAQTVAGTCCFYLTGGAADAAVPLLPHFSAAIDVAGGTISKVASTTRGLSVITLLAGPRYTVSASRRFSVSGQALFGAARGFDADFSTGATTQDTATGFAFALGGFAEYQLGQAIRLRPVQVDYVQSNLPNGSDNRQRNVRFGAGITVAISLPQSRR